MSLLSANTLFHFTGKLDNILGILKNGFHPRYHAEDMSLFRDLNQNIAIPMVCFCDIPLSSIENHIRKYKGYGVGLTKDWGTKNRISPVMYSAQGSQATENLKKSLEYLDKFTSYRTPLPQEREILSAPLFSFGELKKFTYFMKHVNSYDEREWRFVPQKSEEFDIPFKNISGKKLNEYIKRLNNNSPFPEFLKFAPEDVKYIIVKDNDEVNLVINFMKKSRKFDANSRNYLTTKMLTLKNILQDF